MIFFLDENEKVLVKKCLSLLNATQHRRLVLINSVATVFTFLDVLAIMLTGAITSLALRGFQGMQAGDRVGRLLDYVGVVHFGVKGQIAVLGVATCIFFILKSLSSLYFSRRVFLYLGTQSAITSSRLLESLLNSTLNQVRKESIQTKVFAVSQGITNISSGIIAPIYATIPDIIFMVFSLATLFMLDASVFAVTATAFVGASALLYGFLRKKVSSLGSELGRLNNVNQGMTYEVLQAFREIYVRQTMRHYVDKIQNVRLGISKNSADLKFYPLVSKYSMEIIFIFGTVTIALYQFSQNSTLNSISTLAVFLAATSRIIPAVLRIQQALLSLKSNLGQAKRTLDVVESLNVEGKEIDWDPVYFNLGSEKFKPELSCRNLSFRYDSKSQVIFKNLSFDVHEGEYFVVTGETGTGKSTLIDMLIGLVEPEQGDIQISGLSPRKAIIHFPGLVGYVPQENFVLNQSVEGNLLLGLDANIIGTKEIERVLELACLSDFTSDKDGIKQILGEGGRALSGGERQRLGIARALLTKPKFLILDEATNALDILTEAQIMKNLRLQSEMTIVSISHRITSILAADRVLYLSGEGSYIIGKFDEIANISDKFSNLINQSNQLD